MKSLVVIAQVEDEKNLLHQINKQTVVPDDVIIYTDMNPAKGIKERRQKIAENHKILQEMVWEQAPDLVWQLEQDVELPDDCLERLLDNYYKLKGKDFGFLSGVQVGRHGLYSLGAWHIGKDEFSSLDYKKTGIQEVDATGFYCLLAEAVTWLNGKCTWDGEPWGPDVNWGLSINRKKYVDADLHIGHKVKGGIIRPSSISTTNVTFRRQPNGSWQYKTSD